MAKDEFSGSPRSSESKTPIFIFLPNFGSGSPLGPGGQSRQDLGCGAYWFFDFDPKKCFRVPIPQGLCGRSGTNTHALYASLQPFFCNVGVVGDLSDSVVPKFLCSSIFRKLLRVGWAVNSGGVGAYRTLAQPHATPQRAPPPTAINRQSPIANRQPPTANTWCARGHFLENLGTGTLLFFFPSLRTALPQSGEKFSTLPPAPPTPQGLGSRTELQTPSRGGVSCLLCILCIHICYCLSFFHPINFSV